MQIIKKEVFIPFMGAQNQCRAASAVILGCSYEDPGVFRCGAGDAPLAIRDFAQHIRRYHPQSRKDLDDLCFADEGNIEVTGLLEEDVFCLMEQTASSFFHDKRFLLTLGGSRAVSYPLIKAAKEAYPRLRVISLDAHSGREERGGFVSHDNLFTALLEDGILREKDLYCWGCRVGSKKALEKAGIKHFSVLPKVKKEALEHLHYLYKYPVYLTIDIDVMDPPFAPGSGHPVYGGIGTAELLETLTLLQSLNVVGMDVTEIVPSMDPSGITAVLGATIVKESLVRFCR